MIEQHKITSKSCVGPSCKFKINKTNKVLVNNLQDTFISILIEVCVSEKHVVVYPI